MMEDEPPLTPMTPEQSPAPPSSGSRPEPQSPPATAPVPSQPPTVIDAATLGNLTLATKELDQLLDTTFKSSPVTRLVTAMRKIRGFLVRGKQLNWLSAFAKLVIERREQLAEDKSKQTAFTKNVITPLGENVDAFAMSQKEAPDIATLLINAKKYAKTMNK